MWVRGGIGPHVAAGCVAAGAAGVVLDGGLLLARESPLEPAWRERIARWDGSETTVVASESGAGIRVFALPVRRSWVRLRQAGQGGRRCLEIRRSRPCRLAGRPVFARRSRRGLCGTAGPQIRDGRGDRAGFRSSDHRWNRGGTGEPAAGGIVTPGIGPRDAISDPSGADDAGQRRPGFAEAVARREGCRSWHWRFCAKPKSATLLHESTRQLAGRPWGVGILGFVPPELRAEQLAVVREFRPQFALFAGGRPDQAAGLEREGIATYLHVPSPGLLDQYLRDGSSPLRARGPRMRRARGPRSSFVLWEQAIGVVSDALDRGIAAER